MWRRIRTGTGTPTSLAVANLGGDNVTILRNNGSGNFNEPATSPEPAGSFAGSIAAADFDGDTDQDLAVGISVDLTILRNNGAGNFAEPGFSPLPTGNSPIARCGRRLRPRRRPGPCGCQQRHRRRHDPPQQRLRQVRRARDEPGGG